MNNFEEIFTNEINLILNSTIEGIVLIKNGFIVHTNETLLKMLQYNSSKELIGNLAAGLILPSSKKKFIEYNHEHLQEINLLNMHGEIIPAMIQIKDITLKETTFKMVCIIDLIQVKQKENLLLKQSRHAAMGEMISMIAHQWRQPLAAISVAVSNIKLKIALKKVNYEVFDRKINEVNDYLQYMSKTIDDFKNFFQDDKKKHFLLVNHLTLQAINMIKPSLDALNIKINQEDNQSLSKIHIYKNEIIQVILNLINNSKDAFIEKEIKNPEISIFFEETKHAQIIYIQDNAGGIKEEILKYVFEPYFSTKDSLNGTGLGLYMSKLIVEEHCNGKIEVNNINKGCCFKITLIK